MMYNFSHHRAHFTIAWGVMIATAQVTVSETCGSTVFTSNIAHSLL